MDGVKARYRPDIDGLRAVAVMAVILFHFNPVLLPGGFVGVDIFFVISGYLITANILSGINAKSFSIFEFYRRRALRILPNLFFVVVVTLFVAHFIFQPKDYLDLAYSALASVLSVANIYFTYFLDTSYFAPGADQQPLLHIWSLGVEEQFYLFWPLILLLVYRVARNKKLIGGLALFLCCISFLYAEFLIKSDPMFAYYMLPARAGELLVGGLLAFYLSEYNPSFRSRVLPWCLSVLGVALVAYSLWFIDENKGFPGINALPSTLGAALIILAGSVGGVSSNVINRALSLKPVVLVGLLSYSLYLWHWPVMALYRYIYGEIDVANGLVLFALMFVLSWIGYRYVEKPMRALPWGAGRTFVQGVLPATSGVALAVLLVYLTGGFGFYWLNDEYRSAIARVSPAPAAYSYDYVCQEKVADATLIKPSCIINGDNEPRILLWGDSNAAHYIGVLGSIAKESGFSFRNVEHAACPPFIDGAGYFVGEGGKEICNNAVETVKKYLNRYSVVILGGQWTTYAARGESFANHFEGTIDFLLDNEKIVVLLGRVPRFRNIDNDCRAKELKALFQACESSAEGGVEKINSYLKYVAASRDDVFYMDVDEVICPDGLCDNFMDGVNLYYDGGHLSMVGSWKVGQYMVDNGLVPDFFSSFKRLEDVGRMLPLQFQNAEFRGLTDKEFRVNGSPASDGGYIIKDDDSEIYVASSIRFKKHFTENAIYKLSFGSCESLPMFRFRVISGGQNTNQDVQVDCKNKIATPMSGMSPDGFYLMHNDDEFHLYVKPRLSLGEKLSISVYPASGNRFGSYSKSAVGGVVLEGIGVSDI